MSRSLKKVPSSMPPLEEGGRDERGEREEGHQDLERRSTVIPDMSDNLRRARRTSSRPGLRERIDGWSQVGEFAPTRTFRFHAGQEKTGKR